MWYKKKSNTNWFDPRYEEWGPAYFGRFSDMYDNSNYKKTEEKIRELIDSAAKKGNADALKFLGKDKADKENRDIQDLWYVDFSKLEKGRLYAVSLYKVLTVRDDIIIATWDVAQAYKAKQFMRKWSGDGGGLIGDVIRNSENASMPDILIKPKREFADGDPILGMKVRYLGIVKTQFGAIRAFEEVQK